MKIRYIIWGGLISIGTFALTSCEEKGVLVNSNDISYLRFVNNMMTDTTVVSFKLYNEGEAAVIPVEIAISGKLQSDDLSFDVSVDTSRTTLPDNLYELPSNCKIRKGLLIDTIYLTFKNDPILSGDTRMLALQLNEKEGVKNGDHLYVRALIAVTDRLFKPNWWSVNDAGNEDSFANSVDILYLGVYSETKYLMFLDELKKDNMIFDGKNRQVLRKYALKLKNTLKNMNAGKQDKDWVKDENEVIISVPVAG